jgi:hypothetical protein
MANPWISHLKAFRAKHPGMSLREAMKKASSSYKKKAPSSKVAKKKKKTKRKS